MATAKKRADASAASVKEVKWGDQPLYQCSACSFDSMEKANVEAHIHAAHRAGGNRPDARESAEQE